MPERPSGFLLETRSGPVDDLVVAPEVPRRHAWRCEPTEGALVLGSAQPADSVDQAALARRGLRLLRRRSGGGAVLVEPGGQLWFDLFVPADDPLADHDVARASAFVGELWCAALRSVLGPGAPVAVHRGGVETSPWSSRWCFAGLGPGEVTLAGQKLVGLSQRRTRAGAWFFTMAPMHVEPEREAALLLAGADERDALAEHLRRSVVGLGEAAGAVGAALEGLLAGY